MRLFKFDYDDAATRARLEDIVSERTPTAAPQPPRAADVERERKRLRLDVKPRKVMTGDLMSMPMLGASDVAAEAPASTHQPVVDYVKESASFMSALQDAVRVQSGRSTSPELPLESSFITESSSYDIPMSSTLKSRASLSRRIAALAKEGESPRKLLRRISAAAIAEDEVQQESDGPGAQDGKLAEEAIAYRDEQIRQLEERIARRRQLYTPAKASNVVEQATFADVQQTVQRPQLITLHEPTLDAIAAQRQSNGADSSEDESEFDDSVVDDPQRAQAQQDGNTRRFQDGIVLYDSERIPDPPLPDPARVLRNIASAVELRNNVPERASMARASSLLALPTQPQVASAEVPEPPAKRGDRTASSNTLVDRSGARTVSGDIGSQMTISDLGGKGATITRTGSLFNISQIPDQEIESLGRGKLTFNKDLHRWEKVPRSRSSQEDLRSAASSRNDFVDGRPMVKTPIPPTIPEASAELSRSQDVFSESLEEQQARTQHGARTNSFQQRLDGLSSNNTKT
uniref:Uncharacterized protein n=1 Tax=Kalmanozyma brasiliensis (strain GHG001) TaxID=1365824 RepID=V5EB97_KALBG